MPLPLAVSCFSRIQIGITFLVPADLGSPGKRAVKWLCVCVYFSHNFRLVHVHCVPKAVHLLFFEQLCRKLTDINYFGIVLDPDQV